MSSERTVGLYKFRRGRSIPLDELTAPRNSYTALREWLEGTADFCRKIRSKYPGSSHAKLAAMALKEIPGLLKLIDAEAVIKSDPHHLAHAIALQAGRVQRLDHNLALVATVEGKRRSFQALNVNRHKGEPKDPEAKRRRIAQAATLPGADIGELANANGISRRTVFRLRRKYFP